MSRSSCRPRRGLMIYPAPLVLVFRCAPPPGPMLPPFAGYIANAARGFTAQTASERLPAHKSSSISPHLSRQQPPSPFTEKRQVTFAYKESANDQLKRYTVTAEDSSAAFSNTSRPLA